jgi:molecular chaperone GrpE
MNSKMDDNEIMPEEENEGDQAFDPGDLEENPAETEALEDVATLKAALADEESRAEKLLSNWQRAQADLVNYKRRTEQERETIVKMANAGLILNLLSVVDDLERALDHVSGKLAASKWVDGIILIYRKFVAILEANGVSEIKALGEQFDPCFHEAAAHVDGEDGKVVNVIQKGYMLNDKVLRPVIVSVGNGQCPASNDEEDNGD